MANIFNKDISYITEQEVKDTQEVLKYLSEQPYKIAQPLFNF